MTLVVTYDCAGHEGWSFYFVVSGKLSVVLENDTDESKQRVINHMGPGTTAFGSCAAHHHHHCHC